VVTHHNFIDCRRFSFFFFILNIDHCIHKHNSTQSVYRAAKSRNRCSIVFENTPDDFITDVITIIIIIIIALRHGVRVKLYRRRALRKRIFTKYAVVAAAAVVENQTKQQSTPLVTGTSRFCGHSGRRTRHATSNRHESVESTHRRTCLTYRPSGACFSRYFVVVVCVH